MSKRFNKCLQALMGPKADEKLKKEAEGILNEFQARVGEDPEFDDIAGEIRRVAEDIFSERKAKDIELKRRAMITRQRDLAKDARVKISSNLQNSFLEMPEGRPVDGKPSSSDSIFNREAGNKLKTNRFFKRLGDDVAVWFRKAGFRDQVDIMRGLNGETKISPEAAKVVKEWERLRKTMVSDLNGAGANIKLLKDWVGRRIHDDIKITNKFVKETPEYRAASFIGKRSRLKGFKSVEARNNAVYRGWKAWILPRVDAAKTFQGKDPDKFLRGFFDDVMSGNHNQHLNSDALEKVKAEDKPKLGNLANQISQSRTLHFNDVKYEVEYMNEMGAGSLFDSMALATTEYARNKAIMDIVGPGGANTWERWIQEAVSKNKAKMDKDQINAFITKSRVAFNRVTGVYSAPTNVRAAHFEAWALSAQIWQKLGAVLAVSLGDKGPMIGNAFRKGQLSMSNFTKLLSLMPQNASDKRIAKSLGLASRAWSHSNLGRYNPNDFSSDLLNKTNERFLNAVGLTSWNLHSGAMVGTFQAHDLGQNRGLSFNKLDRGLRETLVQFSIDGSDWDVIRASAFKQDGEWYVLPENIKSSEVEDKLNTYFAFEVDSGVLVPDARTQRFVLDESRPGSFKHAGRVFMGQFKSFPITMATKLLSRYEFFGKELDARGIPFSERAAANKALEFTMSLGVSMGFVWLGNTFKNWAQGKTNPDFDTKEFLSLMTKSGGLGIYGDFLFKEYDRGFNNPLLSIFAGPVLAEASEAFITGQKSLFELGREGEVSSNTKRNALRQFQRQIPFNNAPFIKPVLDYIMWDTWNEIFDPYVRRLENRMEDRGQEFFVEP